VSAPLRSPNTGDLLRPAGPDLLADTDGRRWPVIDGIPFLRVGREALADAAAARLAADDRDGALAMLLTDQDDWWTGPKPETAAVMDLIRQRETLTLRAAMDLLGFDRVGHYFAHRWSDPTFLAGLALLEAYWRPASTAFELACGIGHYGRELMRRGLDFTGGDVVFSKLWLARHWVLPPGADLVCFDAGASWPIAGRRFDLVFSHDSFYFLEPKAAILAALRAAVAPGGRLALSHIHNSGADNLSAGRAVSVDEMARFFPDAVVFDDAELTDALVAARAPQGAPLPELARVEAFSVEDGTAAPPRPVSAGLALPDDAAALRLNPLYEAQPDGAAVTWPSSRYQAEYGPRATYPRHLTGEAHRALEAGTHAPEDLRRRTVVDLPERW
jgi:SAM-dependent methyltransferase